MKKILTTTAALAMAFGLAACGSSTDTTSSETSSAAAETSAAAAAEETTEAAAEETTEAPAAETLTLTATNTGKGTVSWGIGGSMNTAEFEGEWTQQIELTDEFDMVTLTVQGDYMVDSNELKCTITDANGEVVDEATGTGQAAMASCNFTDSF
ncbi:hypothetical protein [Rothia nasimurium]|uniref:hypothetical protein n=1 Tax=Rothia nasimurium TaxID=85336 RepID=UPI001F2503A8|nr:hypothetical protein [Rothia nasimurium]